MHSLFGRKPGCVDGYGTGDRAGKAVHIGKILKEWNDLVFRGWIKPNRVLAIRRQFPRIRRTSRCGFARRPRKDLGVDRCRRMTMTTIIRR